MFGTTLPKMHNGLRERQVNLSVPQGARGAAPPSVHACQAVNETVARQAFLALHDYLWRNHYRGFEFDDLLGSALVRRLVRNKLLLQRVAVQAGKLCPVTIRPLLGVRKLESSKGRGFVARGYLYYYQYNQSKSWRRAAEKSLAWLLRNHAADHPGISWGNEFDFASRGGFFKSGLPTIVWTAHIAQSFDLAYDITGRDEYLGAVLGAGEFIASGLERRQDESGACFAYAPGVFNPVHNSNLLGAATLLRCWRHGNNDTYYALANAAYQWTISRMNSDGSWYYGEGSNYRWIDNFHSAYILESLVTGYEIAGESVIPFSIIAQAYAFWTRNFFLEDGTPKYYHDRTFPLDVQCASQAIETLSRMSVYFPLASELADKVLLWTIRHLQKSNGAFRFQRRRFWKNNLESIHWGQSTMLSAIGAYLNFRAGRRSIFPSGRSEE